MTKEERVNRVIARGEGSNHSHCMIGDCEVKRTDTGEILIEIGKEGAVLRHILESDWIVGHQTHTGEHDDIDLSELPSQVRQGDVFLEKVKGAIYRYVPQVEYHPYNKLIVQVKD